MTDPYAGAKTEEERQTIYQELLEQYEAKESARKDQIRASFIDDWNHYRDMQLREDRAFCRHTAVFAAVFLGASFVLITNSAALHGPILSVSWMLFAAVLIINAAIHLTSGFIHSAYCDIVSENVQLGYEGKPYRSLKRWYSGWVMEALYIASFIAFAGGVVCFTCFIALNR
jgi:hypothetical protein